MVNQRIILKLEREIEKEIRHTEREEAGFAIVSPTNGCDRQDSVSCGNIYVVASVVWRRFVYLNNCRRVDMTNKINWIKLHFMNFHFSLYLQSTHYCTYRLLNVDMMSRLSMNSLLVIALVKLTFTFPIHLKINVETICIEDSKADVLIVLMLYSMNLNGSSSTHY